MLVERVENPTIEVSFPQGPLAKDSTESSQEMIESYSSKISKEVGYSMVESLVETSENQTRYNDEQQAYPPFLEIPVCLLCVYVCVYIYIEYPSYIVNYLLIR